jgi:hypothetical protein
MNAGGAQQRLQVPCVEAVGGTHRQWHVDTTPNPYEAPVCPETDPR